VLHSWGGSFLANIRLRWKGLLRTKNRYIWLVVKLRKHVLKNLRGREQCKIGVNIGFSLAGALCDVVVAGLSAGAASGAQTATNVAKGLMLKTVRARLTNVRNKLEWLIPDMPFQLRLMFAGKTRSLPESGTSERFFTRLSCGLTRQH
jgi:hypothetical protein